MKPVGMGKARFFLRKYMWLGRPTEDLVMDFVNQARLGEAPWLTVCGVSGTGKTRLATLIHCLAPETIIIEDDIEGDSPCTNEEWVEAMTGKRPVVWTTHDRKFAEAIRYFGPVIFLPRVWQVALEQERVALTVDPAELAIEAEHIWR